MSHRWKESVALESALSRQEELSPPLQSQEFGFQQLDDRTWTKERNGKVTTFRRLGWADLAELEGVVELQKKVWGMPDIDTVPTNLLAIVEETGGSTLGAYDQDHNLTGFVFTVGTTRGSLFLHMIGVDTMARFQTDLGWDLSVLQATLAQAQGISHIEWTYDPLRGSNARLNLEKLGAIPYKYTVNKYGIVKNALYGESPTDRFTVDWNVGDPNIQARLRGIQDQTYLPLTLADVAEVPILDPTAPLSEQQLHSEQPFGLLEIPGDIDVLETQTSIEWRLQVRAIATGLMTTETPQQSTHRQVYPIGFATGIVGTERRSFYLLKRVEPAVHPNP